MPSGRRQANHHGYVVIDKPAGITSHDVVSKVRRVLGERRVGHAGTLDPAAVGVLPIAVGLATRTVEYLASSSKSYRAEVTFGIETDSGDADGIVTHTTEARHLAKPEIERALLAFHGPYTHIPPMHSALKVGGRRLYDLAREGRSIDVPSRSVTIHAIALVEWRSPTMTMDVTCSKGTYIRSLAQDLGKRMGTGAYLSHLVRTRTGPFTLDDAVSIDDLVELKSSLGWGGLAFHPDWVLRDMVAVVIDRQRARSWAMGQPINHQAVVSGNVRVYDAAGTWLGMGVAEEDGLRPTKVILPAWSSTSE